MENEKDKYADLMISIRKIVRALTEGAVAIALLLGGGLRAMQTASVSSGILLSLSFSLCAIL